MHSAAGSPLWVWQQSNNMQASGHCVPVPGPFEPKINRLRQTVQGYYCVQFQLIPITGFRFILLTYTRHIQSWA